MQRSVLAFAISTAVVLASETSYGMPKGRAANAPKRTVTATSARRAPVKRVAAVAPAQAVRQTEPVQEQLRRDPILAAMIGGRMPAGTNLMTVAAGFHDVGQFAAAVSASKNLGIPFYQLKRRMVNDGMSLGLAIQDMRPQTDYRCATRLAEDEAAAIVGIIVEPEAAPVATMALRTR
jgi:hypothetical protein